jgi:hypothetical protein
VEINHGPVYGMIRTWPRCEEVGYHVDYLSLRETLSALGVVQQIPISDEHALTEPREVQ